MSTEQEDTALLFELEEKITHRIREQIYMSFMGYQMAPGVMPNITPSQLHSTMASAMLNDNTFITQLAQRIGARLANMY